MEFFATITATKIVGLVLLAAGAALSFAARMIAVKFSYEHADMVCRFAGLATAIIGFLIIFI